MWLPHVVSLPCRITPNQAFVESVQNLTRDIHSGEGGI